MKLYMFKLIIFAIILIIPTFCSCSNIDSKSIIQSSEQSKMILCIKENNLCLIKSDEIIRTYDVNVSVLPGEDILILTTGIEVEDETEADSIAENFDG